MFEYENFKCLTDMGGKFEQQANAISNFWYYKYFDLNSFEYHNMN